MITAWRVCFSQLLSDFQLYNHSDTIVLFVHRTAVVSGSAEATFHWGMSNNKSGFPLSKQTSASTFAFAEQPMGVRFSFLRRLAQAAYHRLRFVQTSWITYEHKSNFYFILFFSSAPVRDHCRHIQCGVLRLHQCLCVIVNSPEKYQDPKFPGSRFYQNKMTGWGFNGVIPRQSGYFAASQEMGLQTNTPLIKTSDEFFHSARGITLKHSVNAHQKQRLNSCLYSCNYREHQRPTAAQVTSFKISGTSLTIKDFCR